MTSIGANALNNCSSLKSLTLPESTTKLGKQFAYKCTKLTNLTIKSKKMSKKTIAANAFSGLTNSDKVTVTVPKDKAKDYTTLFRNNGLGKKVKIKKSSK